MELSPGVFPFHKGSSLRRCLLPRFPYAVFFIERAQNLWVISVAHTSRKPDYWNGRLR